MCSSNRMLRGSLFLLFSLILAAGVQAADDLVGPLEKKLSSVKRLTVTEPGRAEKEMLEARKLFSELKAASPDHEKLPALKKTMEELEAKLEKRLGHPVGGRVEEKEEPVQEKPAADTPSALPSSVKSRLSKMDTALTAAAAALEQNRLETAVRKLAEAEKVMEEIQSRYGAQIPEGDGEMEAAAQRLRNVGELVAGAQAVAAEATASEAAAKEAKEAQSREWIDRLSPFFDYKSPQYLRMGAEFNRATEAEQEQCRKAYAKANEWLPKLEGTDFPYGKTQELESLQRRLKDYLDLYNETERREVQARSCQDWVDRFRAYVDVGAGSRKYLVVGVTLGEDEINERAALLEEAKALWPEYEKAEFPYGKSPRLLDLEEEMLKRFREMPEALRQSRALLSGDIEKEFDRVLDYLDVDTGWKDDVSLKPNVAMARDITALKTALDRYAGTVEPDDAKLASLKAALDRIMAKDEENRALCAERTFMLPDRYAGEDQEDLQSRAEATVGQAIENTKILRVTLPAEAWKEESVVEWTDTSKTALRHRTTRFMTAQVAAKDGDGKVFLHSVHLASDLGADGTWGPVRGHIMWSDWMAEKNVLE